MSIIKDRISDTLASHQKDKQVGFRMGFSTTDHIQALSKLLKKTKEFNIGITLMFVDFNKAFDALYHDKIWLALARQNVPKIIIQLLENM